jgi:hypothetical protein
VYHIFSIAVINVADTGCLSRIPDPRSRIPDPKTATKERGEKKLLSYLFCSHKFHKIENYFIFKMLKKKKFGPVSKNWFGIRDPEKNLLRIPDPGPGVKKSTESRIRIRNTGLNDS